MKVFAMQIRAARNGAAGNVGMLLRGLQATLVERGELLRCDASRQADLMVALDATNDTYGRGTMNLGAVEQRRTWHIHGTEAVSVIQLIRPRFQTCSTGDPRPRSSHRFAIRFSSMRPTTSTASGNTMLATANPRACRPV
jgi:hypothetical protein